MSDDKYVPEHEMVRECWIDWSALHRVADRIEGGVRP